MGIVFPNDRRLLTVEGGRNPTARVFNQRDIHVGNLKPINQTRGNCLKVSPRQYMYFHWELHQLKKHGIFFRTERFMTLDILEFKVCFSVNDL